MYSRAIGSFEAKTHFSQILTEVSNGSEVVIMKHGKPLAVLSRYREKKNITPAQNAIEIIKSLQKGTRLNNLSIKAMIEEGRS